MNGKSILKKVLPVVLSIVLLVIIVVSASAITTSLNKAPKITDGDKEYISITEGNFKYSISRNELYTKLKTGIGLSTVITMANKDILKNHKNDEGVSFWDVVTEEAIDESIEEAIYGENDVDTLSEEEKQDLIDEFLNTMKTGYGYKAFSIDSTEIRDHYRLINAKKEYAKYALDKEVKDAKSDDPYFTDEEIEDYYDANYDKNYWALIVPFGSEAKAKLALQQLNVMIDTTYDRWVHVNVVEELDTNNVGTGIYKTEKGEPLTTKEVIETIIKLYVMVYGYKNTPLVEGGYEIATNEDGDKYYKLDSDCDYAIVNSGIEIVTVKELIKELKEIVDGFDPEDKDEALDKVSSIKTNLEKFRDSMADTTVLSEALNLVDTLQRAIDPEDGVTEENPLTVLETLEDKLLPFEEETIIFNFDKEESSLYYTYSKLYEYDSNLPSKIKNSYTNYSPFSSVNEEDASWYSVDIYGSSPAYYVILKLNQIDAPSLSDVRDEIIEKLKEEKLDDNFVETQVAKLRNEYKLVIYDKEIQGYYIEALKSYEDVEFKKSRKRSNTLVSRIEYKGFIKEYSADDLFDYMEKTSGLSTAISELAYQRLLFNTNFNKYKNFITGKWLGEEGSDLRKSIIDQVENQRLYFLSGGYASYGYDPSTMTWEDFLYQVNGATDEYNLADLLVYSNIANDYIAKTIEFIKVDGEGIDLDFTMSYEEAIKTAAYQLLFERMEDMLLDYLSSNGEHLLVCMYETVNDQLNGVTPLDPEKWSDEAKALASEFVLEIKKYLDYSEGTYASSLQTLVNAFNDAPYSVKDEDGNYVVAINDDGKKYKYFLETAEYSIDLSKYKSAGLSIKYESLGEITSGQMVKRFEEAVKELWEKDIEDGIFDNISIYQNAIETEFGFHLYINLSSSDIKTYDSLVSDEFGNLVKEMVDGEEVNKTVESILPSFYEIRLYVLKEALSAVDRTDLSESDIKALDERIESINDLLSEDAQNALSTYYTVVIANFTDSYFSSVMQQKELKDLINDSNNTFVINSKHYTKEDFIDSIESSNEKSFKDNLTYLKSGDENVFNITNEFLNNK